MDHFQRLSTSLSEKYGAPTTMIDRVNPDLLWGKPYNWTFSLLHGERTLRATWKQNLPESLTSVEFEVRPVGRYSDDSAYLQLQYKFDNVNECQNWIKAQENSTL